MYQYLMWKNEIVLERNVATDEVLIHNIYLLPIGMKFKLRLYCDDESLLRMNSKKEYLKFICNIINIELLIIKKNFIINQCLIFIGYKKIQKILIGMKLL